MSKTVLEMAREAGFPSLTEYGNECLTRFAALAAEAERKKFTAVGVIEDDVVLRWNEGITCDEAPEGAELYVRRTK